MLVKKGSKPTNSQKLGYSSRVHWLVKTMKWSKSQRKNNKKLIDWFYSTKNKRKMKIFRMVFRFFALLHFFFFFPFEFQKKRLMYLHRYHCQKQSFEGWETSEQKTQSANILSDWRTAQTIQQTPTTKPKGIDSYDEWTIYRDLLDLTLRSGPPRPQGISCVAVPFQCVCKKFQQQEIEKALYYTNQ